MRCAVYNCKNNNNYKRRYFRFFSFPKDETLSRRWLKFCRRESSFNPKTACICEVHFDPKCFERNLRYEMGFSSVNPTMLMRGAIPTIYYKTSITQRECERQKQLEKHATKQMIDSLLNERGEDPSSLPFEVMESHDKQICAAVDYAQDFKRLKKEIIGLRQVTDELAEVQRSQEAKINEIKSLLNSIESIDVRNAST